MLSETHPHAFTSTYSKLYSLRQCIQLIYTPILISQISLKQIFLQNLDIGTENSRLNIGFSIVLQSFGSRKKISKNLLCLLA